MPALRTRSKYDTFIPFLYHLNKEQILSVAFRKAIPASTKSSWRNNDPKSYIGYEYRQNLIEAIDYMELMAAHRKLKAIITVLTKVWLSISDIITPVLNKTKLNKEKIINTVQRLCTALPKRIVLKLVKLSSHTYHYRLSTLSRKCNDSVFSLCMRRHPLQLSFKEVGIMKRLLGDERFTCWPVASIAWYARRSQVLAASLSTWYKYLPAIGYKRKVKQARQIRTGLVTTAPNQCLHVDTTFWKMGEGAKAAIVFVSDNFSKAILGWNISLQKNAGNIKNALDKMIQTIHQYHPDHRCTMLMADGGKENHNSIIDELLDQTSKPYITKIIAQKDIVFSNASIEAINKIMKVYLRRYKPENLHKLNECIQAAVYDYCFVRPHGSLNGMTPMEVYTNKQFKSDDAYVSEAKAARIEQNRKHICRKIC